MSRMKFGDVFEIPATGYRVMVVNDVSPDPQMTGYTEVLLLVGRPGVGKPGEIQHVGTRALLGRTANSPWNKMEVA